MDTVGASWINGQIEVGACCSWIPCGGGGGGVDEQVKSKNSYIAKGRTSGVMTEEITLVSTNGKCQPFACAFTGMCVICHTEVSEFTYAPYM